MLAVALVVLAAAAPGAHSGQRASLQLRAVDPLTIAGQGFTPRERVRVAVHAGSRRATRAAHARADGALSVTFRDVTVSRCTALVIDAVGAKGDHARFMRRAPACAPA